MAEIDTGYAEDKQFHDAIGEDGLKKLRELEADCIESSDSELFAINPAQSYPMDEWVKEAPDFWKPKHACRKACRQARGKTRTVVLQPDTCASAALT